MGRKQSPAASYICCDGKEIDHETVGVASNLLIFCHVWVTSCLSSILVHSNFSWPSYSKEDQGDTSQTYTLIIQPGLG